MKKPRNSSKRKVTQQLPPHSDPHLPTVLDAIFARLGRISERIAALEANTPMMTVLEEFYERRKNVAIDREVNKQLKTVLLSAVERIDGTPPKPS